MYAFFRGVDIRPGLSGESFSEAVEATIAAPAAIIQETRVGPLNYVRIRAQSSISSRKSEMLRRAALDEPTRRYLADLLRTASLLQPPLYVGKASNLRVRLLQHLDPSSELSSRLRAHGIRIDRTTVAYAEAAAGPDDDATLELIEELLTRLCRPGFVARVG